MHKSGEPSSSLRAYAPGIFCRESSSYAAVVMGLAKSRFLRSPAMTTKKTFDLLGGALAAAEFERKRFRVAPIEKDILR